MAQLQLHSGQRALDVGTGTGTIARGLASNGLRVDAIDPSEALMTQATKRDEQAGASISYHVGKAEVLPFTNASFDLVIAGQCWHWFDRAAAAAEAARVLAPKGRLVIAHLDWLPLPENMVEATEDLIRNHTPDWTLGRGTGLYPAWLADMTGAGFEDIETASFDIVQPYTHEGWRGRIRASAPVSASMDAAAAARFDQALEGLLKQRFPQDPLLVPHRVWWATGTKLK